MSLTCWKKGIILFVLIDNYDSFTWNLWHFLSDLGAEVEILRNDAMSADEVIARDLEGIIISPGPGTVSYTHLTLPTICSV